MEDDLVPADILEPDHEPANIPDPADEEHNESLVFNVQGQRIRPADIIPDTAVEDPIPEEPLADAPVKYHMVEGASLKGKN